MYIASEQMVRKKFQFYGRVQGVGFRWRTRHAADAFHLTGWVRNEYDGSVQMEVQGEEAMIDRLVQSLNEDRYIDIRDMDVRVLPVDEDERRFEIRE